MSVCVALEFKSGTHCQDQVGNAVSKLDCLEELEAELIRQGVPPLNQFVFQDVELLEEMLEYAPGEAREKLQSQLESARQQPEWHASQAGLLCVNKLIELLRERSLDQAAIRDLESFRRLLTDAVRAGDQFRFVVG